MNSSKTTLISNGPNHSGNKNDLKFLKNIKSLELEGLGKSFEISYKSKKSFGMLGDYFLINQIEKIKIVSQSSGLDEQKIDEDIIVIPVESNEIGYFHLIYNVLAEIEAIKKHFPKSKVKVLKLCKDGVFDFIFEKFKTKEVLKAYDITDEDIIDFAKIKTLEVKSLFFIYSQYNPIAKTLAVHNFDYSADKLAKRRGWGEISVRLVKERFIKNKSYKNKRKVFISGMTTNDIKREISEVIFKRVSGESLTEQEWKKISDINVQDYSGFIERQMSKPEELKLEKMFANAGYEVIDPEKIKSIFKQAEIYKSASHIVGISGASMVNALFCDDDTKVLILNSCDSYAFPHEDIVKSFGPLAFSVPRQKVWKNRTYSASFIFESAIRDFPEFFDGSAIIK